MRITKMTACWGLLLVLATPGALYAQEKSPREKEKSCRAFVQDFYNWYIRKLNAGGYYATAIRYKKDAFSPELVRLLEKSERASRTQDQDYLDYDPFVNGQDWLKHYVAEKVTLKGDRCWVNVYGTERGIRGPMEGVTPDIVPELTFKAGRWVFVNFHDPRHPKDDLLSVLKLYYPSPQRKTK
jgi:hypothetical protein